MKKKLKPVPSFATESEERDFWVKHDTSEYFDLSNARRVKFPNLKPSTKAISLRLPLSLLEDIKIAANKRDVPYQSLIKVWLSEKIGEAEGRTPPPLAGEVGRGSATRARNRVADSPAPDLTRKRGRN